MKTKIKICIVIKGFHNGGIERVIENYFSNMDKSEFDLHIVSHITTNDSRRRNFENMGFTVHNFSDFRGSRIRLKNYIEYNELFKKEKFDIVHNNCVQNLLPLYVAKKNGVPIRILHSHADFDSAIANRAIVAKFIYKLALKYNVSNATSLFSCGIVAGRSVFGEKKIDEGKVKVIPNAINTELFKYNQTVRTRIRGELGVSDDEIVIGNVGRFEDDLKNQSFIVDIIDCILKKGVAVKAIFVGDGFLRAEVEEKARRIGVSNHVLFLGAINNVNEMLNAFDYFLFPSKTEGLSMSVVEAQCNGLRGIMTDTLPSEMNVIGTFRTMSLSRPACEWAEEIIHDLHYMRIDRGDDIRQAGYDIVGAANSLKNEYIRLATIS